MTTFFQAALESLWNATGDAIFLCDADGVIVEVNERVESMLGWSPEELRGEAIEVVLPSHHHDTHRAHRAGYMRAPHARRMGQLGLFRILNAKGQELPVEVSLFSFEHDGARFVVAMVRDAQTRAEYEKKLRKLSFHDALTDLHNRAFLDEQINHFEQSREHPTSILVADLDGLKTVNDRAGHQAGDALIKRAATLLRAALRADEFVARTGGDEFVALLPGADLAAAEAIIERIRAACQSPDDAPLALSIGAASMHPDEPLRETLKRADRAMYRDKRRRRALGSRG